MAFVKAEKTKLWARVAIFGPSGSGKSYTALRIAKGMAQRAGSRIAAIDTENRSLAKYADRFDFDVDNLAEKNIEAYLESINQCIKEGYKVLVIDSLTHCWKELLEEIDRIAAKSFSGNSWAAWSKGTPKQNKLVNAIVNFPGHLIVTMRSKTEWSIGKNEDGKNTVSRNGLSPEQGKGIEYEFDILMDINQSHIAEIQKDRTGKFQDKMIEKPGEDFGEALYDWLNTGSAPPPPHPSTLRQQYIDGMLELKNVMLSTTDDGSMLFTDDEYNGIKTTLESISKKPYDEGVIIINDLLNMQKEQLSIRFENWCRIKHPGLVTVQAKALEPNQPEKPAATAETTTSTPAIFTEPEPEASVDTEDNYYDDYIPEDEGETVMTDAQLEIF
jgi:hypothetical protein